VNRTHDTPAARSTPPVAQRPDRACACAKADLALFFPGKTADGRTITGREALAICHICPHEADCLAWALETEQAHGIWGGKTADERYQILKSREVK